MPYSEHSSFPELHALVRALRPSVLVPTVNADTAAARERLSSLFAKDMNAAHDRRTLTWHFRPKDAPMAGSSRTGIDEDSFGRSGRRDECRVGDVTSVRPSSSVEDAWMADVDVEHQHTLWGLSGRRLAPPLASASPLPLGSGSSSNSPSSSSMPLQPAAVAEVAQAEASAPLMAMLAEVIGSHASPAYLSRILAEGEGNVEAALAIHFGPNQGEVPEMAGVHGACGAVAAGTGTPSSSACAATPASAPASEEPLELPPGTVAWVVGKEFKLYQSREVLMARLQELGAAVVGANSRYSKQEVTLIVAPEGVEAGSIVRGACPYAPIVHESWVVRRARAMRAGLLAPPPKPPPPKAKGKEAGHKRSRSEGSGADGHGASPGGSGGSGGGGGEKRAAPFRSSSVASAQRLERAMSERLYLIERRDLSEVSQSGLVSLRVQFAVLGSTGNVYEVLVARVPSCTCVDFRDRRTVCKHLLFVYAKVLRVQRDSHILQQRALLREELRQILMFRQMFTPGHALGHAPTDGDGLPDGETPPERRASDSGVGAPLEEPFTFTVGAPLEEDTAAELLASPAVRRAYQRVMGREEETAPATAAPVVAEVPARAADADEPCAICYDPIEDEAADEVLAEALAHVPQTAATAHVHDGPPSTHCGLGCGRLFHARCMQRWFAARGVHARRECPVCRAAWRRSRRLEEGAHDATTAAAAAAAADDGGHAERLAVESEHGASFLNLGELQPDAQAVRDASSYSSWLEVHQRRREQRQLNEGNVVSG